MINTKKDLSNRIYRRQNVKFLHILVNDNFFHYSFLYSSSKSHLKQLKVFDQEMNLAF